jgi:hypothetical protein
MTRDRNPNDMNNNLEPPFLMYDDIETMNKKSENIRLAI